MINTVLPTPAPPKRPILPPFTYGAIRSTTLIPVSKICVSGERSSNLGAGRWIGHFSSATTGAGSWSTVSPSTLKIRPNTPSPTGTAIAAPVSSASILRVIPSVELIATQRTVSSPKCCITSTTIFCLSCALWSW